MGLDYSSLQWWQFAYQRACDAVGFRVPNLLVFLFTEVEWLVSNFVQLVSVVLRRTAEFGEEKRGDLL